MKIIISGGTGFIGKNLSKYFITRGDEVAVLTRGESITQGNPKYVHWDPNKGGSIDRIDKADIVINLAGYSIAAKRWSSKVKRELEESRINSTKTLIKYLPEWNASTFISASAVGYYGFRDDEIIDERGAPGEDFLSQLAVKWEEAALQANVENISIVRFGVVIGENGGILERFLTPIKYGLSKKIGSGKQWISWVDVEDVVGSIDFIMTNKKKGIYNITSPNPERNEDFLNAIASAMQKKQYLSVPAFLIKAVLGEMGEALIINGQRAIPKRLQDEGYKFKYPELGASIEKAIKKIN
ncbi:MAG: TIGR01777 family oxidoreductase [Thermoplasmata archaeon]